MKVKIRYWLVICPLAVLLALVLVRAFRGNDFRVSAGEIHSRSQDPVHFLNAVQLDSLKSIKQVLIADIREEEKYARGHPEGALNMPVETLLKRENRQWMKNRSIVLYSDDMSRSAAAWALLGQLGITELYLLDLNAGGQPPEETDLTGNESPAFVFQPDTAYALPEEDAPAAE